MADLEALALPTRVLNLLKQAGIEKIGPLIEMTEADILALPGVGEKSYVQVAEPVRRARPHAGNCD